MQGRFALYPTCTRPDQVFGVKPHSDGSGVTVLLQDKEVQGLHVLKEDKWLTVPIIPQALFVNLGDQMQILSNGAFMSPIHRVVTNREREKMTVVMFKRPEPEKEIEPVDQLVDEKRPRLYKKVKNYSTLNYECFQKGLVIGHGISFQFLDKVREIIIKFFELPIEEKQRHGKAAVAKEGYGLDSLVTEKQVLDWSDRLSVLIYPEDQRDLKLWPEKPQDFRETIEEYAMNIDSVVSILFKAMAKSLKLEESSFSKQFGDRSVMQGRFILYPTCTRPDQVFGVKPHSDGSGVTVLLQDKEVQGLQVLKEDQWLTVPVIPHALFVNLGDQMQIMSNGVFKSPFHRVVTNREREKITVAMFKRPDPEKEIEPVDQLVDEKRPRLYKKVKNYAALNYECFQKGLVPLDTVKI
ncbi:hypothetical protein RHMOL_Rhmol03G0277500 [Rhododendron molle]|uniref:Uncharacterized protein n=1 Tax=Rhododendron molle TaxID=49168 RepID=A0ACC0PKH3_RHOML|nr:hypothetical protein RHMOL_Rhmol03G0277500 [Rhododendron molle]